MGDSAVIIWLKELIMSHDVYTDDDLLKDISFILATYNVSVRCWKDILIYVRDILKKQSGNPTFSDEDRMILAAVLSFMIRKDNESRWVIYAYYAYATKVSFAEKSLWFAQKSAQPLSCEKLNYSIKFGNSWCVDWFFYAYICVKIKTER